MSTDESMAVIRSLVAAPLTNVDKILPGNSGWTDAVRARVAIHPDLDLEGKYYVAPITTTRADHIHRRLGHIAVNPTDRFNTKALIESYVYAHEKGEPSKIWVNENPESTKEFLDELIIAAHTEKEIALDKNIIDPTGQRLGSRPFVLHGKRGIGKTFFLNHLLSKYYKDLDDQRVIWVRVNLLENFQPEKGHESEWVLHWIYAQTTKIVMRYYDPKSNYYRRKSPKPISLSLYGDLLEYIKSLHLDKDHERSRIETLVGMREVFHGKRRQEPLTPGLVPLMLARKAFELSQIKGYSHIIVFDGLDRLEVTEHYQKRFYELMNQVILLTKTYEPIGMTFLIVTRTNTLHTLFDFEPSIDPYRQGNAKGRKFKDVPIEKIFARRVKYLEREVKTIGRSNRSWPLHDWPQHIQEFAAFVDNLGEGNGGYHTALTRLLAENKRAQMQAIQLNYFDYLNKKHEKPYLLTETLALAGHRLPPRPYSYQRTATGELQRSTEVRIFDHHLLPSVFLYPYAEMKEIGHGNEAPHPHGLLAGLRILQLVNAHELRLGQSEAPIDRLLSREVAEMCDILFQYPTEVTLALIEEFGEFELLSLGGNEYPVASDGTRHQIFPLPKLSYVLNNFLYDVAYLNIASMRIPFSTVALNCDSLPYIYACSFDKDQLADWIASKITNALGLFRIIRHVNAIQGHAFQIQSKRLRRRHWVTAQKAERGEEGRTVGMFKFVGLMERSVISQIQSAILPSIPAHTIGAFHRKLSDYHDIWR